MRRLTFVIGATASGKSYFIEQNFKDKNVDILNVFDYRQRAFDEAGYSRKSVPFGAIDQRRESIRGGVPQACLPEIDEGGNGGRYSFLVI